MDQGLVPRCPVGLPEALVGLGVGEAIHALGRAPLWGDICGAVVIVVLAAEAPGGHGPCTAWSSSSSRNSSSVQQARSTSISLTKDTHLLPLSGKQSARSIPTHATPSILNTYREGAPEAGKCEALALQTGDPVPAPRLLRAVMPQAPPVPQQSWCSPSRSSALVENWEQEEAAEKYY